MLAPRRYVCEYVPQETGIQTGKLSKACTPPQCGWASTNSLGSNRINCGERVNSLTPPPSLKWDTHLLMSLDTGTPQAFGFRMNDTSSQRADCGASQPL